MSSEKCPKNDLSEKDINKKTTDLNSNLTETISFKKLHDAIPAKYFHRSTFKSCTYLVQDLLFVLITFLLTYYLVNYLLPNYLFWPVMSVYWLAQGTIATGLWVIAHECGHQAFSSSQSINDTVGLILHSFLLTPYHAWKISHSKHHRSTSHMNRDMVFVPVTKSEYLASQESMLSMCKHALRVLMGNGVQKDELLNCDDDERKVLLTKNEVDADDGNDDDGHYMNDIPILACIMQVSNILAKLFFGWPLYLLLNASGQKYDRWASHFSHRSPIFDETNKREIFISNAGLVVMFALMAIAGYLFTVKAVIIYYFLPYLIVNVWLVLITYLHHTDPIVPHYRDGAWTYVKGALATVDRDYGLIINYLHHNIGDTHVAHHLFSKIPHYNAKAVTEIIKPLLGEHYKCDNTFFVKALWNCHLNCHYVPDDGDVIYYESMNNKKVN